MLFCGWRGNREKSDLSAYSGGLPPHAEQSIDARIDSSRGGCELGRFLPGTGWNSLEGLGLIGEEVPRTTFWLP